MSTNNSINGRSGNIGIGIAQGAPDDNTIISTNTNGNIIFDPNGTGWVEIDFSGAKTGLQFNSQVQNRVITLFETFNNAHQYYGFGINAGTLRYQVDQTTSNHVFFAAVSSSASNELMRITGTGFVGIGTTTPHAPLQFTNTLANRRIVLYETANNDHQFHGFGVGSSTLIYQVGETTSAHVFNAATSSSAENELFRIQGNGDVVVGAGTSGRFFPHRMPSGCMYMEGNGTATTITTAGTFYKIGGTTTSSLLNSFTMPTDNKLLYSGSLDITANIQVTASVITNQAAGTRATIAIFQNGTRITGTNAAADIPASVTGAYQSITTNALLSFSTNDYIEIFITGSAGVGVVNLNATNMQVTIGTT